MLALFDCGFAPKEGRNFPLVAVSHRVRGPVQGLRIPFIGWGWFSGWQGYREKRRVSGYIFEIADKAVLDPEQRANEINDNPDKYRGQDTCHPRGTHVSYP